MSQTDALTRFGLTRQEAVIYERLCSHGQQNGYEVAKATGISRSNAYASLAALVDKGAADIQEGDSIRYVAVPPATFCDTHIQELTGLRDRLTTEIPYQTDVTEPGYRTVAHRRRVIACMRQMLTEVTERVYLSVPDELMPPLMPMLATLLKNGKKVVIISVNPPALPGVIWYRQIKEQERIRLIVDSARILTGQMENQDPTCLYSGDRHLVDLFKEAMRNEIALIGRNTA